MTNTQTGVCNDANESKCKCDKAKTENESIAGRVKDKAKDTLHDTKEKLADCTDKAKEKFSDVKEKMKDTTANALEKGASALDHLSSKMKD